MSVIRPVFDPLLGGSLSTGPTGIPASLAGQIGNVGTIPGLPYASAGPGSLLTGSAGVGGLPAIGSAAGRVGSLYPLESSLAPMAVESRLAGQLGSAVVGSGPASFLGAAFTKPTLAKGIGYGLLGQLGSGLIDRTDIGGQNSNLEQGLQGAAIGAGLGAPLGPLGAAIGGIGGSAVGVLANMFGGGDGDAKDPREAAENVLATAIQQAGIDPQTTAQILDTYEIQLTLASSVEDDAQREAAEQGALQQAGAMILQAVQNRETQAAAQPNLLALQQQAQQVFEPLAQDIELSGAAYANAMEGLRGQLPPQFQALADAQVARETNSSTRLADAYRAQAAVTPVAQRLTQYQGDLQNLAAQQMSQALAGQLGGGSAATDLTALLQPTG